MKRIFILIFLSFIVLGVALNSMGILADEDKSGRGSDKKSRVREEIKREFRTDDGRRVKIERKVEIEDGKVKIRIKRKVIDAEGNEIEVNIVIEKDKDGIRKKIKLEKVEGLEVGTELEIDDKFEGNESELVAIMSNGKRAKIKIMPDQLVEIALERLKALNFTMELKEIEDKNQLRVIYNIEANKTGRFLGIFKLKLKLEGQIDPETGEFIRINKPWWAFLVAGEESDQVGEKITLCHVPPGNPEAKHTISVGAPAVKAHLGRHGGDTLGPCSGGGNGNETEPPGNETNQTQISPTITIDSPTNTTFSTGGIDYNITLNEDLHTAFYSVDNGANLTLDNDTNTHYFNISSNHPSLADGFHNITFWVNDTSGNANESTVFFTVNTTSQLIL